MSRYVGNLARIVLLPVLVLVLAGCSGGLFGPKEPSLGDRMIAEGEAVSDLGEMWNDGRKMIDRGESLINDGERLKERGHANADEGLQKSQKARAVIEVQQRAYAEFASGMGPLVSLPKANQQLQRLEGLVRKWRNAAEDLEDGREQHEKGQAQIKEGDAKIAEGDAMRRKGHQMMLRAEQSYNSDQAVPASLGQ